jgi:hypothetical protein
VIGQSQRLTYTFIDHYFEKEINPRELLSEVYSAGQAQALSRAIA